MSITHAGPIEIELHRETFTPRRRLLMRHGAIRVHAFRYASGVEALEVEIGAGRAILLPFDGQQIWDAEFHGRRLTMDTWFHEPENTRDYMKTYGAFFLHCGGTAMGNPGPEDDHPLHGELPHLPYQRAALRAGQDEAGRAYVELIGEAEDRFAFAHHFVMRPVLRLTEASAVFDLSFEVENKAASTLPFFYLAHVNFRPQIGARIIDAIRDDARDINLRVPGFNAWTPQAVKDFHAWIGEDVSRHREIREGDLCVPELVMTMQPPAGADGWSHALQLLPDGSADVVSHRPEDLEWLVRWSTRWDDRQTLGFSLPSTSAPDGRTAALRDGQVIEIAPGERFATRLRFGMLLADEAKALQGEIARTRG